MIIRECNIAKDFIEKSNLTCAFLFKLFQTLRTFYLYLADL